MCIGAKLDSHGCRLWKFGARRVAMCSWKTTKTQSFRSCRTLRRDHTTLQCTSLCMCLHKLNCALLNMVLFATRNELLLLHIFNTSGTVIQHSKLNLQFYAAIIASRTCNLIHLKAKGQSSPRSFISCRARYEECYVNAHSNSACNAMVELPCFYDI